MTTPELPPRNNCRRGDNCLIHLHSAAGHASLLRQILPFLRFKFPDGILRFRSMENHLEIYQSEVEILTKHLKKLKENAQILHHKLYERAVVVLPAILKIRGLHSYICRAAYLAGFNDLVFLDRALIAAYNQVFSSSERKTYLIFELGGGILEISLLTPLLEVRSSIADTGCPLCDMLICWILNESGIDLSDDWTAMLRLRKACELAKDYLCSGIPSTVLFFYHQNFMVRVYIYAEVMVQLNLEYLRENINQCLMEAGARQEDIGEVILAGDSTAIPEVRGLIREFFPRRTLHCDTDIQDNAAQAANRLSSDYSTPFLPLIDIFNAGDIFFY